MGPRETSAAFLDFLGLLKGRPEEDPFDWEGLLDEVSGEYVVVPGPARGEWDASPA